MAKFLQLVEDLLPFCFVIIYVGSSAWSEVFSKRSNFVFVFHKRNSFPSPSSKEQCPGGGFKHYTISLSYKPRPVSWTKLRCKASEKTRFEPCSLSWATNQPTYLPTYRCVSQSPRFNISHPNDILLTYFLYTGVHFRVFDAWRRIGNNDVSWKRRKEKRFLNFALRHFSSLKVSTDDDNRYFGFALTNRSHDWKIIGFCFVVVCVFELR